MKKSLLLLITILASIGCFGQKDTSAKVTSPPPLKTTVKFVPPNESDTIKAIRRFIGSVKKGKEEVAKLVDYPFERPYPIPSIDTKEEFLMRYNEIFDDKFVSMIINSDPYKDWELLNSYKYGDIRTVFNTGDLLFINGFENDDNSIGKLHRVRYESKAEQEIKNMLIEADRQSLHESIRNFKEPILIMETVNYKIRIDDLNDIDYDNNFRFALWLVYKDMSEKPDLVLYDGRTERQVWGDYGNLVYDIYMFEKSGKVYVVVPTEDYMNGIPPGLTILSKKELEEKLEETGLTSLLMDISKDKTDIARGYRDFD